MRKPLIRLLGSAKRTLFGINRPAKDLRREIFKNPFDDISRFLSNQEASVIFDVGANIGQTTSRFRRRYPYADIYSFEPFPNAFDRLRERFHKDPRIHTYCLACSSKAGQADLHISSVGVLNSLLPPIDDSNRGFSRARESVTVLTTTIDVFCGEHNIDYIDILKIDVQGAEELVLSGSRGMLDRKAISLILTEVQFIPFYRGQSWYYDVFRYLAEKDYHLFDMYNMVYGKNGHIRWADAIFLCPELHASCS